MISCCIVQRNPTFNNLEIPNQGNLNVDKELYYHNSYTDNLETIRNYHNNNNNNINNNNNNYIYIPYIYIYIYLPYK